MRALITGASSGMGRDMARVLSCMGWELFLVARRADKLLEIKQELGDKTVCIRCDISKEEECRKLYEVLKDKEIDMVINNAGFGYCGEFVSSTLENDLEMIDTNVRAVHILTKLFLKDFVSKNSGRILNVASIAGFMPGPMMATYYATKNYVTSLSRAVSYELKEMGSAVTVTAFCPGPVNTEFNQVAGVSFATASLESKTAARIAITDALNGKRVSIPTFKMKLVRFGARLVPDCLLLKICSNIQQKKIN